ncbi:hypothetical protein EQW78_01835 [Oerskovia turbata]|uniref:Integral membrane protein n=1 Tax=Oerskovia turbata TaxID=1713 RepID=A0A4Q1L2I4_9CELL|nr:hypothetical protein [Oerskovia turbata]RXR27097.1 hypothetical protein EQW73_06585 [Oerskovia turbata]RXR36335.1 hypothetical protein EQW78_01835 [Oerskovia turbata]TGJ95500.1 hypothetical protein DLJ96_13215 [Actinotalea fermentans ATCC 43279 = JCM 9966 = DSM 3133]
MTDGDEARASDPDEGRVEGGESTARSWKNVDHHAQRDAMSDRFARGGPADFLYGAVVSGFMLAVSSTHSASDDFVILAVAGVLVGYWAAHVYVSAIGGRFRDSDHTIAERLRLAASEEVWVLIGGVPALAVFLVGRVFGLGVTDSALIALWFTVLMLGVVGHLAAHRAGVRGWALTVETAVAAGFGLLIIGLKTLLH